jgi:hypothetical protein
MLNGPSLPHNQRSVEDVSFSQSLECAEYQRQVVVRGRDHTAEVCVQDSSSFSSVEVEK